ncbi:shikimate dehydrogenase family protein [Aspergillus lucknowensis]|uniref:Uncharacterized protein n=1 Tax=Aspergillus lucknowensis TaxID=176173 RepID=A0ABR4LN15_9EURO
MANPQLPSKKFYIFGSGISFSISPTIHNTGFKHHNLPYTYEIHESENIDGAADIIADSCFGGASVTMPHKLQVHKYCDTQTETARTIGAINTLIVKNEGLKRKITGDNTDWSGLYAIIANYTAKSGHNPQVGLVIGAGGASRAALYAMYKAGVRHIYLVNRTLSVAEEVKTAFRSLFHITVVRGLADLPRYPEVIVGTIPADTTTEAQFASLFHGRGLCIDMSYKPRQTPLLTVAQRHTDWATVTGVEVLLAQGFDQYRLWTGKEPPRQEMVAAVWRETGATEGLSLL